RRHLDGVAQGDRLVREPLDPHPRGRARRSLSAHDPDHGLMIGIMPVSVATLRRYRRRCSGSDTSNTTASTRITAVTTIPITAASVIETSKAFRMMMAVHPAPAATA